MATKTTAKTSASRNAGGKFTAEEKAAMRERAREAKAAAAGADLEQDLLAKIAEMPDDERVMAERIHAFIKAEVPSLAARTWYGMPAWAKDGKVVCHFQPAAKFKSRYSTFGFSDEANIDEGSMWPTAWGMTALTDDDMARLGALIKQAVS